MTWIEVYQIARYFLSEAKKRDIDPQEIDLKAELDPMLTFSENKGKVQELLAVKPTTEEQIEVELGRLAAESGYRVLREEELDKLIETEAQRERLKEKVKQLRASWKQRGEEAAELEKEIEKLREEVKQKPAITIEILTNFREGIQYFRKGDVLESHNIEWAVQKIEQGLARRVGAIPIKPVEEKPKEVKPPVPPETERERALFLKRKYRAILERHDVPTSYMYDNFLIELEQIIMNEPREQQENLVELFAMEAVREYQAKRARVIVERIRPVERPLTIPIIPEEEIPRLPLPKPIPGKTVDLWIWLLANYSDVLGISMPWRPEYIYGLPRELKAEIKSKFFAQPKSEQDKQIIHFHSYFPEITGSLQEWLETRKGIKYADYVNMSNIEKAELFDEYIRLR